MMILPLRESDLAVVVGGVLLAAPTVLFVYTYLVYPAVLWCLARVAGEPIRAVAPSMEPWPEITITIPVYNEAHILRATLEHILGLEYPEDRRHVVVISDASTDGTDDIAREYANRGVDLVRLSRRAGKTAAENAAAARLRGEIVVNVDATARPGHGALKALVAAFAAPDVGVASCRDVSIGSEDASTRAGESAYLGYEMWVRGLETRLGSIVGASGCFYAIRRSLYEPRFPEALSRDFASALIAREHGKRAVSVDAALCGVPRARSLHAEYRRKVRTMHRGLETLWYKRHLLDPFRYGRFSVMLFSHKLCRWMVPLSMPVGAFGLLVLATTSVVAAWFLGTAVALLAASTVVIQWMPRSSGLLHRLSLPSYVVVGSAAGVAAWWEALRRQREATWEPTRRAA